MSDGVGGGGRVLHNVIGLKAYASHFQLSCKVRVAHQFKVEHCFTAMLLFLVLTIHISYVYTYRLKFS